MNGRTAQRLAILIAVLSLIGGTGFFTQRYQVDRLAKRQLEKAALAVKQGDFAAALKIYQEHLQVFKDDPEIMVKYADTLLKVSRLTTAREEAVGMYYQAIRQTGASEDVRRSLINLKVELGRFVSSGGHEDGADVDLKILLDMPKNQDDSHLLYLMGQCHEHRTGDAAALTDAVENYRKVLAIEDAPDRIDAGERLANLLRDQLNQPKEAEDVMNKLVQDTPEKHRYRAYLARGRFRSSLAARNPSRKSSTSEAKKDFEKARSEAKKDFEEARKLAPAEPEAYLLLARAAMDKGKVAYDEARRILKDGLEKCKNRQRFARNWPISSFSQTISTKPLKLSNEV